MFNLYPYNTYILYIACIALVVMIIYLLLKVKNFVSSISTITPSIHSVQNKSQQIQTDITAIKNRTNQIAKIVKPLTVAIPLLLAIKKEYDSKDELEGIKGYEKAADTVMTNRAKKRQFQDILQTLK